MKRILAVMALRRCLAEGAGQAGFGTASRAERGRDVHVGFEKTVLRNHRCCDPMCSALFSARRHVRTVGTVGVDATQGSRPPLWRVPPVDP